VTPAAYLPRHDYGCSSHRGEHCGRPPQCADTQTGRHIGSQCPQHRHRAAPRLARRTGSRRARDRRRCRRLATARCDRPGCLQRGGPRLASSRGDVARARRLPGSRCRVQARGGAAEQRPATRSGAGGPNHRRARCAAVLVPVAIWDRCSAPPDRSIRRRIGAGDHRRVAVHWSGTNAVRLGCRVLRRRGVEGVDLRSAQVRPQPSLAGAERAASPGRDPRVVRRSAGSSCGGPTRACCPNRGSKS
jgi:hypothetical protein